MLNRGIDHTSILLLFIIMASLCDLYNCSTSCYNYSYCISLPSLPPLPPLPSFHHDDSFDDNSSDHHTGILIASLCATVFVLIMLAIARSFRDSGAHHDEPLPSTPPTPPPTSTTTILAANPNNYSDDTTHHVWLIRTVGLDDHIIKSIATSVYNGTSGHGSTEYCSVCLGEFFDGEEIKLLRSCCHVFHALCIDTWLRSHLNCPLCRKAVMDGSDHSEPKQDDHVITIDSVSEFGSLSSRSMDSDDDMMPSSIAGSFDGLFSTDLCDAANIFLPSKALAEQEIEHIA